MDPFSPVDDAELEALRNAILEGADGLPFELIVGPVCSRPEIEPDWIEPDDFDWENDSPPYTGRRTPYFTAAWKAVFNGNKYGRWSMVFGGDPESLIQEFEEDYKVIMKHIKIKELEG